GQRIDDALRADDIRLERAHRMALALRNEMHGGKMDDESGLPFRSDPRDDSRLGHVRDDAMHGVARTRQVLFAADAEVVEHADLPRPGQQFADQARTDEPGASGDQCAARHPAATSRYMSTTRSTT